MSRGRRGLADEAGDPVSHVTGRTFFLIKEISGWARLFDWRSDLDGDALSGTSFLLFDCSMASIRLIL